MLEWPSYYVRYLWWYVAVQFPTFDWHTQLRLIGFWALMVYGPIFAIRWGIRRGRARLRGEL